MDQLCRSYSLKEKHDVVRLIDLLVANGLLHTQTCVALVIPYIYYRRWKKVIAKVGELEKDDSFNSFNMNVLARKIHRDVSVSLLP